MGKNKKRLAVAFAMVLLLIITGKIIIGNMIDHVRHISVSIPNMTDVRDGTYIGEYSISPVSVKVQITVRSHQIMDITLLQHENGLGSAAENIVKDVVSMQTLEVDAIAGATVSSKCILKAIEDALENGGSSDEDNRGL